MELDAPRMPCLTATMKSVLKRVLASPALTGLATTRLSGCVLILAYHDIGPNASPSNWLRVREEEFDRQLTWLSTIGRFIDPSELPNPAGGDSAIGSTNDAGDWDCRIAQQRGLRFLLTFDDGYVNNRRLAVPILARHRAPALFFVSTWHAMTGEPFWFDRVAVPIQAEGRNELDLRDLGLQLYRFRPQDNSSRWDDLQRLLADIKQFGNPGHPVVDSVLKRCDGTTGEKGRAALAECRPLRLGDIRAMHATGLCHFGSHGHRHEILTCLDDAALVETMRASRAFLEGALSPPLMILLIQTVTLMGESSRLRERLASGEGTP